MNIYEIKKQQGSNVNTILQQSKHETIYMTHDTTEAMCYHGDLTCSQQ